MKLKMTCFILILATVIVVSGCGPKAACGNRHEHKKRAKRVKKFAPSMTLLNMAGELSSNV